MLKVPDRDVEYLDSASDLAVTDLQGKAVCPNTSNRCLKSGPGWMS